MILSFFNHSIFPYSLKRTGQQKQTLFSMVSTKFSCRLENFLRTRFEVYWTLDFSHRGAKWVGYQGVSYEYEVRNTPTKRGWYRLQSCDSIHLLYHFRRFQYTRLLFGDVLSTFRHPCHQLLVLLNPGRVWSNGYRTVDGVGHTEHDQVSARESIYRYNIFRFRIVVKFTRLSIGLLTIGQDCVLLKFDSIFLCMVTRFKVRRFLHLLFTTVPRDFCYF